MPSGPPLHLAVQLLSQTLWRHGGLSMTFVSRFTEVLSSNRQLRHWHIALQSAGRAPCSIGFHRSPSDSIGSRRCPHFGLPSQRIYPLITTLVRAAMTHHHGPCSSIGTQWNSGSPTIAGIDFFNDLATLDAHTGYPYADGKLGTGICGTC